MMKDNRLGRILSVLKGLGWRRWVLLGVNLLLLAAMGASLAGLEKMRSTPSTLSAARRFQGDGETRFAQLAGQYAGPGDVVLFEDGLSPDALRRLCGAVLHACGDSCFCACFSGDDSSGYKYAIGQQNGDLRALVRDVNQTLNGRGGGKPDFVQGSVQASREEIEGFFRNRRPEG